MPPRAVEALFVSPGAGDAELQPLHEGDHACFVFPGGVVVRTVACRGCGGHGGARSERGGRGVTLCGVCASV